MEMNEYVAFLRAINVAGHARVKMTDLGRAFTSAGCKDVRTYIQSGNVLFESPDENPSDLIRRIQLEVRELLGGDAAVFFRTVSQLESLDERAPFKHLEGEPDVKLYVAFLSRKPLVRPKLPLISAKEALEVVAVSGLEAFVVSRRKRNGFYGFPNNFVEKELGVPATTRNWSTIGKILALAS